jgi:transglutaminase-like putative cysteine protease
MIQSRILVGILLATFFFSACQSATGGDAKIELTVKGPLESTEQIPSEQTRADEDLNDFMQPLDPSFEILNSLGYSVQQRIKLVNSGRGSPTKQNLWVALIKNDPPYQEVTGMEISPDDHQLVTDEYGNQYAEFDFSGMPPDSEIQVEINYQVNVNQLQFDLSTCEGELPDFYTSPELHIESSNPQIISLSQQLVQSRLTACDKVRAIYDYVGDELVYTYNGGNWGAQAALGQMGADCTEYSSLMIALSRAAGVPARYIEGLSIIPQGEQELARQEHAWLEVYLPGIGWTPMDPTLGRSSITREQYYAKLPPDHIIVTRGRNPSTLRGASYWTYLYWPGNSSQIKIEEGEWKITALQD